MQCGDIVAGKYRLKLPLGSGGMAEVWSATNAFTERQVAIKFMSPRVAKTPESAARFLQEAKVSARVNHPNIIDVLDVGQTDDGQLFLVMELLVGCPLDVALRRQHPTMSLHALATLMVEVGEALSAAHRSGIVHRDLKPTNIFLHEVKGGGIVPKLLDFGVSKFLEDDANHALTVAGTVLGSPLYMSPEQARGDSNVDGRTDIFAFGTILFEALCGYRPYEAKNFNALIVKIATTRPKDIDVCAPYVPEALRRIVRACMETSLEARAQTFDEVLAMLRDATPELEASGLRLPSPIGAEDAANMLDGSSPSERRPASAHDVGPAYAMSSSASLPSAGLLYASGTSSSQTPNTSYASVRVAPMRTPRARWSLAAASAAIVVIGVSVGALFAAAPHTRAAASSSAPELAAPAVIVRPSGSSARDVPPTVRVEALPEATPQTSPPASARPSTSPTGSGRLELAASPGGCVITIDGTERGSTPLTSIELPAGPHQVLCQPRRGRLRTASVTISEGATSKYRFALED